MDGDRGSRAGADMEPMGVKLRRRRRREGLTLDELAAKTAISKPYLSLIETGRVPNPPSDEKLRKLERVLGFNPGELLSQAHLQRTPRDVREALRRLVADRESSRSASAGGPINLDDAYLSGMLHQLVESAASNIQPVGIRAIPVINKVAAGYPTDFTDLDYPKGVADDYVSGPGVEDPTAFGARVCGDSMTPKYGEGQIVVFSPQAAIRDGDDCFVRFEDGTTTFKRVFFETDDGGAESIRLQPRNERYPARIFPRERINGLYRAVYKYERIGGVG